MSRMPNYSSLGAGPVVLFLHGIGGGHLAFAPQLETFAQAGYRAVAWDMPGYGHSDPIEPYTFKGLAEKCIALIDALAARDGQQVSLVGHSMGSLIALEAACCLGDQAAALVMVGTAGLWMTTQQELAPLEDQGYIFIVVQAPQGASLEYTMGIEKQVEQVVVRQVHQLKQALDQASCQAFAVLLKKLVDEQIVFKQTATTTRSEERRVGKECRSRWSPYH